MMASARRARDTRFDEPLFERRNGPHGGVGLDDDGVVVRVAEGRGDRGARRELAVADRGGDGGEEAQRRHPDVRVRGLGARQERRRSVPRVSRRCQSLAPRLELGELVDVRVAREGPLDRREPAVGVGEQLEGSPRERDRHARTVGALEAVGDRARGPLEAHLEDRALLGSEPEQVAPGVAQQRDHGDGRRRHGRAQEDVHLATRSLFALARDARRAQQPRRPGLRALRELGHLLDGLDRLGPIPRPLRRPREELEARALGGHGGERLRGVLQREAVLAAALEEARPAVVRRATTEPPERARRHERVEARQSGLLARLGGRALGHLERVGARRAARDGARREVERDPELGDRERGAGGVHRDRGGDRVVGLRLDRPLQPVEREPGIGEGDEVEREGGVPVRARSRAPRAATRRARDRDRRRGPRGRPRARARPSAAAASPVAARRSALACIRQSCASGVAGRSRQPLQVGVDRRGHDALVDRARDDPRLRLFVAEPLPQARERHVERGAIGSLGAARQPALEDRRGEGVVGRPGRDVEHRLAHELRVRTEHVERTARDDGRAIGVELPELAERPRERLREPRGRLGLREQPRQGVAQTPRVARRQQSIDQPPDGVAVPGSQRGAALAPAHGEVGLAERVERLGESEAPRRAGSHQRDGALERGGGRAIAVRQDGVGQGGDASRVRGVRLRRPLRHATRRRAIPAAQVASRRDRQERGQQRRRRRRRHALEGEGPRPGISAERGGHPLARDHGSPRVARRRRARATLPRQRALPGGRGFRGRVGRERAGVGPRRPGVVRRGGRRKAAPAPGGEPRAPSGLSARAPRTSSRAATASSNPASIKTASKVSPSTPPMAPSRSGSRASPSASAGDPPGRGAAASAARAASRDWTARAGSILLYRLRVRATHRAGGRRPATRLQRAGQRARDPLAGRIDREGSPEVLELRLVLRGRLATARRLDIGLRRDGGRNGLAIPVGEGAEQLGRQRVVRVNRHRRIEGRRGAGRLAGARLEDARAHEHVRRLLRLHVGHRGDGLEHARGPGRLAEALEPRRGLAPQLDVVADRQRA